MSECRWTLDGPDQSWTFGDIRQYNIDKGLVEIPDLKGKLQQSIDSQTKAGEEWGFDDGRIDYIKMCQQQQETGIAFHNPYCFMNGRCNDQTKCLIVWKENNKYKSDQCNSVYDKTYENR